MENGIIRGSDIIDVNDLKQTLEEVDKQLLGLEHSLQEHSSRMRIEISNTQSVESLQKIAAGVQSLVDAMAKVNEAKEANKQALRDVTNELKLQAEAAKLATEQEKTRTQASKSATEQAKQQTEYERQFTEAVRQEAEQKKADAKATAELTIANAKAATEAAKVRTEAAKLATEQAKQQKIQSQMNSAAQRRNAALQQETQFVKDLRDELENNRIASSQTLQQVSLQNMAYSELSQIASVLGQRLKEMSAEEKATGSVGAEMVRVTKEINEELARQDANVARYSRNVGNYRSAFDGLGYSIQQVLREVPSALNVQQFFLAISNNIPMVVDQIKLFQQEQKNIAEQLSTMTAGTQEYINMQGKVMSLGKKFTKSIFSWQTAILAALLLLRKLPDLLKNLGDKMDKLIGKTMSYAKALANVNKGAASTVGELTAKYKALRKEFLGIADQEKADWVKKHKDSLKELGLQINNVNDAEKVYRDNTKSVIDAIQARAKSVAAMKLASEKYEEAFRKQVEMEKKMNDEAEIHRTAASVNINAYTEGAYNASTTGTNWNENAWREKQQKKIDKAVGKLISDADQYITRWVLPDPTSNGAEKNAKTKIEKYESLWKEYMENRYKMLEEGEKRERQQELDSYTITVNENRKTYETKLKDLEEYGNQQKWGEKKIEEERKQLYEQWNSINESAEKEHNEKLLAIFNKYQKERNESAMKALKEQAKHRRQAIIDESNEHKIAVRRRVKTEEDELIKNRQLTESITMYRKTIDKLNSELLMSPDDEEKQKTLEYIEQLTQKVKELQAQIDHTKQISTYSSIGDMLTRKGVFEGGDKRAIMENLLGSDAYAMYEEGSEAMMDAIAADYDKWLDATESALTTWYNTTIGYIGELITAFTELSQAKADAAKEDTETAKEAYDREKALLDAGYASRVDAAWNEYLEKKAIQEQAEKDAKKAQLAQQAIDTATQASSLVTAIANMFKTMSAIPGWGVVAAGALSASMLGLFTYTKAKAIQATQYGEGGFEMVEQGGSHASGNDTELGVTNRHGKRMVVERNEGIGVFNTRAMRRYGRSNIERFVRDINQGGAALASVDADRRIGMTMVNAERVVKLDKIESGLTQLVDASKSNIYVDKDGNVIFRKGNVTTKYLK